MRIVFLFIGFLFLNMGFSGSLNAKTLLPSENFHLGKLRFESSTSSGLAQAHFLMGLKYLHNFMYPLALREFQLAQQADPNFVMSYWGKAMSYNWPLWSYHNMEKGRKVIQDFHALKQVKAHPLERDLMAAVEELYKPRSLSQNGKSYLDAMRAIYNQNPNNPDVASFYALALIAYGITCPYDTEGEGFLATARQILTSFIKIQPAHPGVIHYYIHAVDVPNSPYPKEGLVVIPNVYQYLNGSSHVLHMPSHLYTALGSWREAAHSNDLSIHASHALCRFLEKEGIYLSPTMEDMGQERQMWTDQQRYACDAENVYHSMEWLQYEDLELGKTQKAAELSQQMTKIAELENQDIYYFWAYRMQARQILYTQNYKPITSLPKPLIETSQDKNWAAYSECGMLLAKGIAAVKNKQLRFLTPIDQRFESIQSQLSTPAAEPFKGSCILAQVEVRAYKHAYLEHNYDTCSNELNEVQKLQNKLQSSHALTLPYLTSQEIFGELLIDQPRYWRQIEKLYEDELRYYPNRALALQGLKRVRDKMALSRH